MYNTIVDTLIMTAEAGKRDAVESWGVKSDKIRIIYNPQDIADLRTRSAEPLDDVWFKSEDIPVIIGAGRLTKQKGFDNLLRAFAKLAHRRRVRLIILGQGELERELQNMTHALDIADVVRFLGFQSNHLRYIARANVFVLSSIWEAMPMVLAETMAIGTPIVAFDCPSGPREMLDGGACGFLVPDQNVEALAGAMAQALDRPEEARALALRAKQKVERFDVHRVTEQYQALLSEVVTGRNARTSHSPRYS
jgi:glycosyltransferase involved in cell wall biosynthesis